MTASLKAAAEKSLWTKALLSADVMKFSVSAGVFEVGVPSSVWPRVPETQPPIQVLEGRETFRGQLSITEGL